MINDAESYRVPMQVSQIRVYTKCNNIAFPVCPRCDCAIEREYQLFCDRCGQKLKWKAYGKIKPTYI